MEAFLPEWPSFSQHKPASETRGSTPKECDSIAPLILIRRKNGASADRFCGLEERVAARPIFPRLRTRDAGQAG